MTILRVKSGSEKGKTYEISGDNMVIGREDNCEIQVADQGISRKHSEIFRIGEMFFIRDLESRNHTFVNEKEVDEELLRIGDRIQIGNTTLVFEDHRSQMRDSSRIISRAPVEEGEATFDPTSTISLKLPEYYTTQPEKKSEETRTERYLNVLLQLSHVIAEESNLSAMFNKVSEVLGGSLGADHIYILGIHPRSDTEEADSLDQLDILGRFDKVEDPDQAAGVSRGIVSQCLEQKHSILTSDASLDLNFNAMASVVLNQIRSVICAPITVLGKNLGVLYIYSGKPEAFQSEDLELASAVGIQLGSTLELLKQMDQQDRFFRSSVKTLVAAAEMRTPSPRGACERIASYSLAIARELGWDAAQARNAWLAAMLHEIGSIPMSDQELENQVLNDPKRNHYAREILSGIPRLEDILPAIEQQNERWNGSGSPEGLEGESITPLARVLGIAKELDNQLYGQELGEEPLPVKASLVQLRDMAEKQFDTETVNALLIAYRNGRLFDTTEESFKSADS